MRYKPSMNEVLTEVLYAVCIVCKIKPTEIVFKNNFPTILKTYNRRLFMYTAKKLYGKEISVSQIASFLNLTNSSTVKIGAKKIEKQLEDTQTKKQLKRIFEILKVNKLSYQKALKTSLKTPWEIQDCTDSSCWCSLIVPSKKIPYISGDKIDHIDYIVHAGVLNKIAAQYLVNLHNKNL